MDIIEPSYGFFLDFPRDFHACGIASRTVHSSPLAREIFLQAISLVSSEANVCERVSYVTNGTLHSNFRDKTVKNK